MAKKMYDFAGWATRANIPCSDGRIIMRDAFRDCDGQVVPLVWNHNHSEVQTVLGHAMLKSVDGDIYAYCSFNDTDSGRDAKLIVEHGDVCSLSIYANQLKEMNKKVMHGVIREVSLVLAGANPGARIESVMVHGEDGAMVKAQDEGIIYTGESIILAHAEEKEEEKKPMEKSEEKKPEAEEKDEGGETIKDVFNTLNEKQKTAVYAIIGQALEEGAGKKADDDDEEDDEEEKPVKHNVFENDKQTPDNVLSHAEGMEILELAKSYGGGSLMAAMEAWGDQNGKALSHADLGINNISTLFPEHELVKKGAPETLTTDQGWIGKVLGKVNKSPMSRLRTRQADVRNIEGRRAKGYKKGTEKDLAGNIDLLGRTTDPITVYVKSKLDRDDIVDITDFDVVDYMYQLDRQNLNEELARAIMLGDGRSGDKAIDPTKIRPIWLDDELYTIHRVVDVAGMRTSMNGTNSAANFGDNYVYAEAIIESLLYAREKYKGSGQPDFFCTPHLVNIMLLARDLNGRRIYDNVNELKAALNVGEIITAEQFEGKTRTVTVESVEQTRSLLGIMVNLTDYTVGCVKKGEITHFTDFDINFNQEVSLLETRCSGALLRPFSAIALEEVVTGS